MARWPQTVSKLSPRLLLSPSRAIRFFTVLLLSWSFPVTQSNFPPPNLSSFCQGDLLPEKTYHTLLSLRKFQCLLIASRDTQMVRAHFKSQVEAQHTLWPWASVYSFRTHQSTSFTIAHWSITLITLCLYSLLSKTSNPRVTFRKNCWQFFAPIFPLNTQPSCVCTCPNACLCIWSKDQLLFIYLPQHTAQDQANKSHSAGGSS